MKSTQRQQGFYVKKGFDVLNVQDLNIEDGEAIGCITPI